MKKFLVVGGAGYIGGVCVEKLLERGDQVVILDNLKTGHRENINPKAAFFEGEKGDRKILDKIFSEHEIDTVFDFAALIQVGESVKQPYRYYKNNFCEGLELLDGMVRNNVKKIIFSSTAAVFGDPKHVPISEDDTKAPINPYGESKYFFEQAIKRISYAQDLKYTIFRYFNACGATKLNKEDHVSETHLIPLVMMAATGKKENVTVLGTDYDTPDGSGIRDYIHVEDLIDAHLKAVDYMDHSPRNEFNLGSGKGYSVKEVISAVEEVSGLKVPVIYGNRREGDPARLIASSQKAKKELGWEPKYTNIEDIVKSAWLAEHPK